MSEGNENTNGNILSEIYEYNARFPFLGKKVKKLWRQIAKKKKGLFGGPVG
jgi:hypothetical protein